MTTKTSQTRSGRKARVDSTPEMQRIMQGAALQLAPPAHVPLEDQDMPFWESIVAEQPKADWTEHQLEVAALLARTMANMEEQQRTLRDEGFTSYSEKGTPVPESLVGVVKGLANDILALRRSLALHARGKTGDNRNAAKTREKGRQIEGQVDDEDDLIAKPS